MNDNNRDPHDTGHPGAVLLNTRALQACSASLMTCISETAGQEDGSLDAFLPPLRDILIQMTTFGCRYLDIATPQPAEENHHDQ